MKDLSRDKYPVLHRQWRTGDRIELQLPMSTRIEAIDAQHPDIVALMYGPLVLFPLTHTPPQITRQQLLDAKRTTGRVWQATTRSGMLDLHPFTEIDDENYCTYLHMT